MGREVGEGLTAYFKGKIEELEIQARDKQLNLRRLEAQRNELNTKGDESAAALYLTLSKNNNDHKFHCAVRLLREELQLLQEPGSYVGEVAKARAFWKLLHAKQAFQKPVPASLRRLWARTRSL